MREVYTWTWKNEAAATTLNYLNAMTYGFENG